MPGNAKIRKWNQKYYQENMGNSVHQTNQRIKSRFSLRVLQVITFF